MNSLFRIDRNSIREEPMQSAGVAILPGLHEVSESKEQHDEDQWEEPAQMVAASAEERLDAKLAEKVRELNELQQRIEQAQEQAQKITEMATEEAEKIREEARETGYEQGIRQVQEEYEQEVKQQRDQTKRLIESLKARTDEAYEQIEEGVLDFSLYLAEVIIKRELDRDDTIFLDIVRDTLDQVKNQNEIVLRLNSEDYDKFFSDGEDEFVGLLRSSGVEIRKDMAVQRGECAVETEYGTLRSGIRTQLKRMEYALRDME